MISNMLKTALVAGSFLLGATVGGVTPASAGNGYIAFDAPGFSVEFGDRVSHRKRHRGYHHGFFDEDYGYRGRRHSRRNRCTPRRAVRKARRNGIRRAHVVRAGRRGVVVAGRQWGERVVIGFGRHRHCPIRFVRAR